MPRREPVVLLAMLVVAYAVSASHPADVATWWMETGPVFLVLPVLATLELRLGLTSLALRLLAFEALIVAVGAHYTYAHVPLGDWVSGLLGLTRNHYDRLAHFFQGVVPAILLRELLLRTTPLPRGRWLFTITSSMCLALSAVYEFIEWWAAVLFAEGATEFLGTQGDPWDTQWDMFLALLGSIAAQLVLARLHDRQLRERGVA
jgi:putative membrane protein